MNTRRMSHLLLLAAALALLPPLPPATAADSDWPCVQRKVPEITAAAVWTRPPLGDRGKDWRDDPAIAALVERLAARRTPLEEAEKEIAALARSGENAEDKLIALFVGLLNRLNLERGDVIDGIERYGAHQKALAEQLRKEESTLDRKRAAAEPDAGEIADLSDRLLWDLRIFDERQKSLSFVCEVPVLIEQRMFALARAIQSHLE